jgi:hypothetical protein
VGREGEGGGGTGNINNTCLDYIQCDHNSSYYILDSIIDFNSLRYECCLGVKFITRRRIPCLRCYLLNSYVLGLVLKVMLTLIIK